MSIIGTRPPLISETSLYELHHRARLAIKPGITGMWQVSGRSDIVAVFSLVIELAQLLFHLGTFQISDLTYNTLGGAVGGVLYYSGYRIIRGRRK